MASPICIEIPTLPDPRSLALPGGVTIEHLDLLDLAQPALAPFVPLFDIVDAVLAVFQCIKAIPEALGPPPDPTVLAACLPELARKAEKLLRLVPQLSLPRTIIDLIDLAIDELRQPRNRLVHLQQQMQQLEDVLDRAAELDDAALLATAQCIRANIEQEAANVGKRLAPLARLLTILNLLLDMIGGPELPALSSLAGRPLDDAIAPIDALLAALERARAAVPVP